MSMSLGHDVSFTTVVGPVTSCYPVVAGVVMEVHSGVPVGTPTFLVLSRSTSSPALCFSGVDLVGVLTNFARGGETGVGDKERCSYRRSVG